MNFFEEMVNSLLISGPQDFGFGTLLLAMILASIASSTVATLFYRKYRHRSDATLFATSLVLFGLFCCVVTLVVGSNIARAFGLIGALSIIRFRNTVKSIEDMMFLFWTLAVGMCLGAGFYALGMAFTAISIAIYLLVSKFIFFERRNVSSYLVIRVDAPKFTDAVNRFEACLRAKKIIFSKDESLSALAFHDQSIRLFYNLKVPGFVNLSELNSELRGIEGLKFEEPPAFMQMQN